MSSFRLNNGFRLPENEHVCMLIAEKNLRKRYSVVYHVTKCIGNIVHLTPQQTYQVNVILSTD